MRPPLPVRADGAGADLWLRNRSRLYGQSSTALLLGHQSSHAVIADCPLEDDRNRTKAATPVERGDHAPPRDRFSSCCAASDAIALATRRSRGFSALGAVPDDRIASARSYSRRRSRGRSMSDSGSLKATVCADPVVASRREQPRGRRPSGWLGLGDCASQAFRHAAEFLPTQHAGPGEPRGADAARPERHSGASLSLPRRSGTYPARHRGASRAFWIVSTVALAFTTSRSHVRASVSDRRPHRPSRFVRCERVAPRRGDSSHAGARVGVAL
jgi:hypothetical protein